MGYKPRNENAEWLTWALERVQEVPYKPTARWLFYRCVQELGFKKSDYKRFLQFTSKVRKNYWNGWDPETLSDDTRNQIGEYGVGFKSVSDWFDSQKDKSPVLEWEKTQNNIVFVCFEAKAMIRQFKYHLEKYRISLWPFGGDASIPYKFKLAEDIEEMGNTYPDKNIYVLYFGDYDKKGLEIPENAMRDIKKWCGVDFQFKWLGIKEDDIKRFDIPDNPDAPGKYQWEAVDEGGAEVIINRIFKYFNIDGFRKVKGMEYRASQIWSDAVESAIVTAKKELDEI